MKRSIAKLYSLILLFHLSEAKDWCAHCVLSRVALFIVSHCDDRTEVRHKVFVVKATSGEQGASVVAMVSFIPSSIFSITEYVMERNVFGFVRIVSWEIYMKCK